MSQKIYPTSLPRYTYTIYFSLSWPLHVALSISLHPIGDKLGSEVRHDGFEYSGGDVGSHDLQHVSSARSNVEEHVLVV